MARSTVAIRFIGDALSLRTTLADLDTQGRRLGSGMAATGKAIAAGLAVGAVGAVALGKNLVDAAVESQKVTKQTEAVLKSMGNQAGLTANDVADLSEKLAMQSGVDDELIQSASNVLLTFGKVRNEVGKGNDIFSRAQQSALDMSVALGTDLQGATVMLGKALNDPVKGITAMSRAGVSFTQQQKDQIKTMVEAGDTLGAQKLIMAEMEKQFGGSAAAQATAGDKLKVVFGNLQETLGGYLLPVVEKVAGFLANNLPAAFEVVGQAMEPVRQAIGAFVGAWTNFQDGTTSSGFNGRVEEMGIKAREIFEGLKVGVTQVVAWFQENWPKIRDAIVPVMETIGSIVTGVLTVLKVAWENFGNNVLEFVQRVWPAIALVIEGAMNIIQGVIKTVTSLIQGDWSGVWEGIKQAVGGVWAAIQGIVRTALEAIRGIVGIGMEVVGSVLKGAWNGLLDFIKGMPGQVASALSTLAEILTAPYRLAFRAIKNLWNDTVGGFGFEFGGWDPPGPGSVPGIKFRVPEMHTGGIVPGGPSNEPLYRLQGGEGVFTPAQMRALGAGQPAPAAVDMRPVEIVFQLGDREMGRWTLDALIALGRSDGVHYVNVA